MYSYKQEKKEGARNRIWEKAIANLTTEKDNNLIISEAKVRKMWRYTFNESVHTKEFSDTNNIDDSFLNDFCDYIHRTNPPKRAEDLKIIYFCGPEPENDLKILIELGVKIENIWAIEKDSDTFHSAVERVKSLYPNLKIFRMDFKAFCEIYQHQKFDIIYLDFTQSSFSVQTAATIHNVFDYKMLQEFGVLITTNSVPSEEDILKNEDKYLDLLTSMFVRQTHVESSILGRKNYYEVLSSEGLDNPKSLKREIKKNFKGAYSSFSTLYPIFYSNQVAPAYRIFKNSILSQLLINSNSNYTGTLDLTNPTVYFVNNLNDDWKNKKEMYEYKNSNVKRTRKQCVELLDVFSRKCVLNLKNEEFEDRIAKTFEFMQELEKKRYFCDVIFEKTLREFTVFQMGIPNHVNYSSHDRFSYIAKTNEMNVDIFVFDECRSIYDWWPLFDMYENNMKVLEKQIILRIAIDLIGCRQNTWAPIKNYSNSNSMIAVNEPVDIEYFHNFNPRETL